MNPNKHAAMIIEWASTGKPVWYKDKSRNKWILCEGTPVWEESTEYSFEPPKMVLVKNKIIVRVAVLKEEGSEYLQLLEYPSSIEDMDHFVRWANEPQGFELNELEQVIE